MQQHSWFTFYLDSIIFGVEGMLLQKQELPFAFI